MLKPDYVVPLSWVSYVTGPLNFRCLQSCTLVCPTEDVIRSHWTLLAEQCSSPTPPPSFPASCKHAPITIMEISSMRIMLSLQSVHWFAVLAACISATVGVQPSFHALDEVKFVGLQRSVSYAPALCTRPPPQCEASVKVCSLRSSKQIT